MKITIGPNAYGLEGEYEFEMSFQFADHRKIKKISGLRVLEYQDALASGDVEFIVALTSIALDRVGKAHDVEDLFRLPDDALTFDMGEEEDASPPPQDAEQRSSDEKPSSGGDSNGATESSPETWMPEDSGIPLPASTSDRLTSTI